MYVLDPKTSQKVLITRDNVKKYFPFFGCHDHTLDNHLYKMGMGRFYCPFEFDCIKETNKWRRQQQEQLGLDKPRLERQNLTRAERMAEWGITKQDSRKLARTRGYDIEGHIERMRSRRNREDLKEE